MLFFRKNKRQFGIRSHRNLFVAIFLFLVFGISGIVSLVMNANAQLVPVASVEFYSEHADYNNHTPGAWKVTKSARWTDAGKAQITIEVDSIERQITGKKYDVVMVMDKSGSMYGEKIDQVKHDAKELINDLLDDAENRVALVSFNQEGALMSQFTNDKASLTDMIDNLNSYGDTSYYEGFLRAEDVLTGYEYNDSRRLILLFLTDGYPNSDTPNEVGEYRVIKENYPYIIVNGIQYEMGDTVLQPIIDISDHQYIAYMNTLNNILFEATYMPYRYDDFVITDYINDAYWNIDNITSIAASNGTIDLSYEGETPKITWDMGGKKYISGRKETLTIDIDLKSEFIDLDDLLLPTNKRETITSSMPDMPDESIDSTLTPVLKDSYNVIYDANLPRGCRISGTVPARTAHSVLSIVEISDAVPVCEENTFKGWHVVYDGLSDVKFINDDHFIMPERDVVVRAIWARPGIEKSLDGAPVLHSTATIATGQYVNGKLKTLSGQSGTGVSTANYSITAILRSDVLPESVANDTSGKHIISTSDSKLPVYAWFDEGTIYYYTDAQDIYLHSYGDYMFRSMYGLSNIEGLKDWNTSKVTGMSYMFAGTAISDVDALKDWNTSKVTSFSNMFAGASGLSNIDGLKGWDTSNVTTMADMFYYAGNITNVDALLNWDTTKVKSIRRMFYYNTSLQNVDGLRKWDTSNVTSMDYLFGNAESLTDIKGLTTWNTSKVTSMQTMFSHTSIKNIDALLNWNTANVTNMQYMFDGASKLQNIDGAINWDVSKITSTNQMFQGTSSLKNIDGAINWRLPNVTNAGNMFANASSLENIDGAIDWGFGKVTDMAFMFQDASSLKNIDGAVNWDISKVTRTPFMFDGTSSLTDISGLANWNTSKITNMAYMFSGSGIQNADAFSAWDTSSAVDIQRFFYDSKIQNVNGVANWNTSNVTTLEGFFMGTSELTDISGVATKTVDGVVRWDTSKVTNMSNLFYNSNVEIIDAVSTWNTSSVTYLSGLLNQASVYNIDALSTWDTSKVRSMDWLFANASNLQNIDGALNWDLSSLTDVSNMFYRTRNLQNIDGAINWKFPKLTNMSSMFDGAGMENIDGAINWDLSNVTTMTLMFKDAQRLRNLDGAINWNVSNVTSFEQMFADAPALEDISGLANWNTSSATSLSSMFNNYYTPSALSDISPLATKVVDGVVRWDVSHVRSAGSMFGGCPLISDLSPLNTWDTSRMTNMSNMFSGIPESVTRPTWYQQ